MKFLFVIESLAIGGAEKSLVNLLNSLDFTGCQVDLFVTAPGGVLEKELPDFVNIIVGRPVYPITARLNFLIRRKTASRLQTEDLFWQCYSKYISPLSEEYDCAVAYSQGFATYFVSDKVKARKKLAWVNTDYQKAGYNATFDVDFYKNLNGIVTVSEAGYKVFKESFKPYNLKIPVYKIEDLLGIEKIRRKASESVNISSFDGLKMVSVGRLHPAKGFDMAVEAAVILKNRGLKFRWWIVGEGAERPKLEKSILKNNLQDMFFLVGADTNPYKYMNAADIYIQTSVYEGFSITVREALALNKVVVTTNFPSVYSAVSDGVNGLIATMDPEVIAEKIVNATDKDTRQTLLKNLNLEVAEKEKEKIEGLYKILFKPPAA